MSLQTLDRTQWSYAKALAHVQSVTVARRAVEAAKLPREVSASIPELGAAAGPDDRVEGGGAE